MNDKYYHYTHGSLHSHLGREGNNITGKNNPIKRRLKQNKPWTSPQLLPLLLCKTFI